MDDADLASSEYEHHVQISLKNRKITKFTYSFTECDECGDEIPEKRRSAIPGVKLCVDCQKRLERKKT